MSQLEEFVYKLQPNRSDIMETMTAEEEASIGRHFVYLQQLMKEQILIMAGPCKDAAFGLVIFRAHSLEEARAIMEKDPAITEGVMTAELHPFKVSLMQGQNK